jgi:simple sugar transport system permease protein
MSEAARIETTVEVAEPRATLKFLPRGLSELKLIPVIAMVMIIGTFVHDAFFTRANLVNVLQQSSELSVLVIAEALILIAGKFDLSIESVVGVAPMVAAWLVSPILIGGSGFDLHPGVALLVMFLIGALVGAINGFMVARLKINAFMATLGMLILLRGITIGVTNGKTMFDLPEAFLFLGNARLLGVPASVWLAGLLYLVVGLFLRYHRFGRSVYAVGGSPEAARAAGIRVERVVMIVFIIGGVLAALAGLMLTGRLASVLSGQGQNMIFTVFAASVIGGISLNGGKGSVLGALTGVLLLGIIANILTLSQIEAYWINAAFGGIILAALVITRITTGEEQDA